MSNIKALVVGGLLGILATLTGLSAAKADCHLDSEPTDYELAFELAEYRCDTAVDGWAEEGVAEPGLTAMYEACMRLSVPPMVLSPAQHYDATDGAFWRTGGAL